MNISNTTIETLIKAINDEKFHPEMYWSQGATFTPEQIQKCIEEEDGYNEIENEIFENNYDYICEERESFIKPILENHLDLLQKDEPEIDLEDYETIKYFLQDLNLDIHINFDMNLEMLHPRDVPVRIQWYSNYDCFNSNYLHDSTYSYDDYFKEIIDHLYLNPRKVKEEFVKYGFTMTGSFPNYHWRNGKEFCDYYKFAEEIENNTCASLLVFTAKIDFDTLVENRKLSKITIPKGNLAGLFSEFQGGGSMLELELLRDKTIHLDKKDKSGHGYFSLSADLQNDSYSITNVYGLCESFFNKSLIAA